MPELTATEMAMEIANQYLDGSEKKQEIILSCFSSEEKETFIRFIGFYRLYRDQAYYDAVKKAVMEQCLEGWKEATQGEGGDRK